MLLRAGRWVGATYPAATSPAAWTREIAAAYVAAVDRMHTGDWAAIWAVPPKLRGKPLGAAAKAAQLKTLSAFFRDCQEWGWIPRRFDPRRCFGLPRSIKNQLGPDPRVIADDRWAKLLWAGLNLTAADLITARGPVAIYPLAMVRAIALVWLFAGVRRDEIRRLRVGCVRWQREPVAADAGASPPAVCLLDVPTHKTGPPFTKPVDRVVGEAIAAWEAIRPAQPALVDPKTGEVVQLLFAYRGRRLGLPYINDTLIPALCRKVNVPESDARGVITSHRARATIATQLLNAKEPLSLFELQAWLGHRSPRSTEHYARFAPTTLARAYADADYFSRNVRTVAVLLDQDALRQGAATSGEPWRYFDLGHGYCSYDFFDQCPHRMACAKCSFYVPKPSTQAQTLEGKANLLRLLQEIPLSEDERAAVEDGVDAFDQLLTRLADVPTPAGPTPHQLADHATIPLRPVVRPAKADLPAPDTDETEGNRANPRPVGIRSR
jgi:integrase